MLELSDSWGHFVTFMVTFLNLYPSYKTMSPLLIIFSSKAFNPHAFDSAFLIQFKLIFAVLHRQCIMGTVSWHHSVTAKLMLTHSIQKLTLLRVRHSLSTKQVILYRNTLYFQIKECLLWISPALLFEQVFSRLLPMEALESAQGWYEMDLKM